MSNNSDKISASKKILIESIFVFFIAITPFLYKVYDYLPKEPDATISIFGLNIGSNGFADVSTYIWFLSGKIIPLILLLIWFFSSKSWWYHILIIPIAMYAFQLFEAVFSEDNYVDTQNIFWLLPVCALVIPFVYYIRLRLIDKYVNGIDLDAMEAELKMLKEKKSYKPTTDEELEKLKNNTLFEIINRKLSTRRIEAWFQQFQNNL
ncbi:hypothetical protein JQC67_12580 [Aurantibacter crassamenti]|uniref:hypothetical protein n=1 Tax=Aurantibacter crassamenti TaxID=1837375 RepID=UPI001939DD13|nr:hypothetical protein [Aurantibacter crassamenti]MBM1106979.1 hypothetical protein [Aurantibacter crassamenti]